MPETRPLTDKQERELREHIEKGNICSAPLWIRTRVLAAFATIDALRADCGALREGIRTIQAIVHQGISPDDSALEEISAKVNAALLQPNPGQALLDERDTLNAENARLETMLNAAHSRPIACPASELRPNEQQCKRCGAVDGMNFSVPDETWAAVAGPEWSNANCDSVLCLACFDDLADQKDIDFEPTNVLFVGKRFHRNWSEENARLRERLEAAEKAITNIPLAHEYLAKYPAAKKKGGSEC